MRRHLILVPTEMERRGLAAILAPATVQGCQMALCGFGPVAAAARTAQLLAEHAPERVLLVGIAGRIDERLTVGEAYRFERVACYGVGAGSGAGFVRAEMLGWQQWPGHADDHVDGHAHGSNADPIGDVITCGGEGAGLLVTACAASADAADVRLRTEAFPAAAAEDMEGFAVALACRLRGVAIDIVRGISNTAGDRDKARWQISPAVEAAGRLALQIMAEAP